MMACVVLGQNMAPLDMASSLALTDISGGILEIVQYNLLRVIFDTPIE